MIYFGSTSLSFFSSSFSAASFASFAFFNFSCSSSSSLKRSQSYFTRGSFVVDLHNLGHLSIPYFFFNVIST